MTAIYSPCHSQYTRRVSVTEALRPDATHAETGPQLHRCVNKTRLVVKKRLNSNYNSIDGKSHKVTDMLCAAFYVCVKQSTCSQQIKKCVSWDFRRLRRLAV